MIKSSELSQGDNEVRKGFTLIELLIVVAIIAILAAIAIPNFLEAQVRAKVSRAKSDMRTIAAALESYAADYSVYPRWVEAAASTPPPGYQNPPVSLRLIPLTTPVAYISSIPAPDPFKPKIDIDRLGDYKVYDTYDYVDAKSFVEKNGDDNPGFGSTIYGRQWRLCSCGPDRIQSYGCSDFTDSPVRLINFGFYDPSNGTTSFGDIVRLGAKSGYFTEYNINFNQD